LAWLTGKETAGGNHDGGGKAQVEVAWFLNMSGDIGIMEEGYSISWSFCLGLHQRL
jgi:hypothetical protein